MTDKDPDPQHRYTEQYDGHGSGSATEVSKMVYWTRIRIRNTGIQNSMMDKDPDPQHRYPEQYDGQGSGSTTQVSRTV
jgi:hypothetical protein